MGEDAAVGLGQILRVITVNFLAVKWPEPESSLRAIMVEPSYDAALPTRMVVQAIGFPSIFYNVSLL